MKTPPCVIGRMFCLCFENFLLISNFSKLVNPVYFTSVNRCLCNYFCFGSLLMKSLINYYFQTHQIDASNHSFNSDLSVNKFPLQGRANAKRSHVLYQAQICQELGNERCFFPEQFYEFVLIDNSFQSFLDLS